MPTLANASEVVPVIGVGGTLLFLVMFFILKTVRETQKTKEREQTKREIAAYIAEGSMTPEQGERLLKADMPHWERGRKD
ncbi:MAG: hypothetical protein RBS39_09140 [Phycisphaerales bacterium]|jgi:hypothetical protein|nr:hypothetical protein [Phycisphaerales bacterium]